MQEGSELQPFKQQRAAASGAQQFQPVWVVVCAISFNISILSFDALSVNGQCLIGCILRHNFKQAFGILSVKRFSAAIVFLVFPGFVFVLSEHAGFRIVRAPSPEVFVPFAHIAVRQSRRLAQQLVHDFVQFVHVFGERLPIGQMARAQRVVSKISFQIGAAVSTRQNVLHPFYERAVVAFVCGRGVHGVIETHGV